MSEKYVTVVPETEISTPQFFVIVNCHVSGTQLSALNLFFLIVIVQEFQLAAFCSLISM